MFKSFNNNEGIIHTLFSGIQKLMPHALGLDSKTSKLVGIIENKLLGSNALSLSHGNIKNIVGLTGKRSADLGILAVLSVLTLSKLITNDKKALVFHIGFLALAIANYYFTDYDGKE